MKGEKNHEVMNDKNPPFTPLAKEILNRNLNVTIICESPITWKDSLKMKSIFENLGHVFR
jgi:deoxyribonuclease-4